MSDMGLVSLEAVLLHLAILIVASRGLGEVFARLGQSAIVGEILAGVLLGPAVLNLMGVSMDIWLFTVLGIYFLLFLAGYEEIDLSYLATAMRPRTLFAAVVSLFVPLSLYLVVLHHWLGIELLPSVLVASVFALTSLSVVLRCLVDLGIAKTPEGVSLLSTTILNEFMGLLVAGIALELLVRPGGEELAMLPIKIVAFFALAALVGHFLVPRLITGVGKTFRVREASFATLIALILLFSYFATLVGLHGAIGALVLGFTLSRAKNDPIVAKSVEELKGVAYGIFIPIFFAGAGLYVTLDFLEIDPLAAATIVLTVPAGKLVGGYLSMWVLPAKRRSPAIAYGQLAKGGVEFAMLSLAVEAAALSTKLYSLTVLLIMGLTIAASTLLSIYVSSRRDWLSSHQPLG